MWFAAVGVAEMTAEPSSFEKLLAAVNFAAAGLRPAGMQSQLAVGDLVAEQLAAGDLVAGLLAAGDLVAGLMPPGVLAV